MARLWGALSIPTCTTAAGPAFIHTCDRLRKFKDENLLPSPLAFKQLSAGIEHLAFSADRADPLRVTINSVEKLEKLAAVMVQYWVEGEKHSGAQRMYSVLYQCS